MTNQIHPKNPVGANSIHPTQAKKNFSTLFEQKRNTPKNQKPTKISLDKETQTQSTPTTKKAVLNQQNRFFQYMINQKNITSSPISHLQHSDP